MAVVSVLPIAGGVEVVQRRREGSRVRGEGQQAALDVDGHLGAELQLEHGLAVGRERSPRGAELAGQMRALGLRLQAEEGDGDPAPPQARAQGPQRGGEEDQRHDRLGHAVHHRHRQAGEPLGRTGQGASAHVDPRLPASKHEPEQSAE